MQERRLVKFLMFASGAFESAAESVGEWLLGLWVVAGLIGLVGREDAPLL